MLKCFPYFLISAVSSCSNPKMLSMDAHGDETTSAIVGRRIDQIDLPEDVTVGALVRNDEVLIAHDNLVIQAEDHMILFLSDKRQIPDVEKLFQVSVTCV